MPRRMICKHPVSTSARKFEVPIRLDTHTGVFSATVDGVDLRAYVLTDLRDQIEQVASHSDNESDDYIELSDSVRLLPRSP